MKPMIRARALTIVWLITGTALASAAPPLAPLPPAPEAAATPEASLWSRLWRTPDQRGQALLQQGAAAQAAQTFTDPQHKGYAALQAHDYATAAKALTGIDTAPAHYNRGNALAHSGDLQGAIAAYDAALQHNPQHTDARHNRDVVAAALKKQQDDKKDSSQKDPQHNEKPKDKDKGNDKGNDNDKKDDSTGDQPPEKPEAPQSGKEGQSEKKPGTSPNEAPGDKPKSAPPPAAPQAGGKPAPEAVAPSPKDEAAQAQRDAQAALGKGPPPPASASGKAGTTDAAKPPLTEKQIAQEQWLRAIPDDPGGLLRRKFLIEHMLRQQGQKP